MLLPWTLALVVGLLYVWYRHRKSRSFSPCTYHTLHDGKPLERAPLPSPPSALPVLGNLLDAMKFHKHRWHDWLLDHCVLFDHQPWELRMLGRPPTIVVSSPQAFEEILQKQSNVFQKGPVVCELLRDFLGRGIVAVDGDAWKHQRALATKLLLSKRMKTVLERTIQDKVTVLCKVLDALVVTQQACSWKALCTQLTSDIFAYVGFGVDLNELEHPQQSHPFMTAMAHGARTMQARFQQPTWLWKTKRWLNVGMERKAREGSRLLQAEVQRIVLQSLTDPTSSNDQLNLVRVFLEDQQQASPHEQPDVALLRDMALNFFAAGKDTTSQSLVWFIIMMNRFPAIATRVRKELATHVPDLHTTVPNAEALDKLVFLEACIYETMRLNGMALGSRTAMHDTVLPHSQTFVPAGTRVIMAVYAAHRNEKVWGPTAQAFDPDRWLTDDGSRIRKRSPFEFMAFFGGPRMCVGRHFAMMELKMILAVVMARYSITTVENAHDLRYELSFTFPVHGNVAVQVATAPMAPMC